jgi:hypothetical protein
MKSLAVLTVLATLTGGVALAQSSAQDFGKIKTDNATFTDGIVEANTTTSLTIKTDTGARRSFVLDDHTVNAKDHAVGSRVKVSFHTNENGVAIADEIMGPASTSTSSTTTTTQSATTTPAAPPVTTETEPTPPAEPAAAAPAPEAPAPTTSPAPANLPKTASSLPTLAALGLASLAGLAALRLARH